MNRSINSNLSSNSDFTIKTGPSKMNVPLGHSAVHDHYIKPVPPIYVTEYEEKFVWPNASTNSYKTSPSRFGSSKLPSPKSVTGRTSIESIDGIKDNQLSTGKYWDRMEKSLIQLHSLGYDRGMSSALLKHIRERDFVEGLDYAYNHFQKILQSETCDVEDVRKMMLDFVHSVDILKGYETVKYENLNKTVSAGDQRVIVPTKSKDAVNNISEPKSKDGRHNQPKAEWLNDKTIKVSLSEN